MLKGNVMPQNRINASNRAEGLVHAVRLLALLILILTGTVLKQF